MSAKPTSQPNPQPETTPTPTPALAELRHRDDGWTAQRQRDFLEALASCGSVAGACGRVGMSRESAYALRRRVEGRGFAQAWDAARALAVEHLTEVAWDRAVAGEVVQQFYHGELVGETRRYDNRLLLALIAQGRAAAGAAVSSPELVAAVAADWEAALERVERGEALDVAAVAEPGVEADPGMEAAGADPLGPALEPERDSLGYALTERQQLEVGYYGHWWDDERGCWLTNWPAPDPALGGEPWAGEEYEVDDEDEDELVALLDSGAGLEAGAALDEGDARPKPANYARTLTAAEAEGLERGLAARDAARARRLELYRRHAFGLASPAERASIAAANGG